MENYTKVLINNKVKDVEPIEHVKTQAKKLFTMYVNCVLTGVKNDFGREPKPDAIKEAQEWWDENIDNMIGLDTQQTEDFLSTEPMFNDLD